MKPAIKRTNLAFAFFNNHWQGYAPRNAVDMKRALKLPVQEFHVPEKLLDEEQ